MKRLSVKLLSTTAALIFGSGLTSVYALTETDFTNTGVVLSTSSTQFEDNNLNNDSAVVVLPKGMVVTKTADATAVGNPTKVGDVISYTIAVENIGLLSLTGITLNDSIISSTDIAFTSGDVNGDSILDHDEIWLYSADYAITQSDIDTFGGGDGDIDNEVSVTANELSPVSDSVEVSIYQDKNFILNKVVDIATISAPATLSYTIDVINAGNASLTGIVLTDTLPDGSAATLVGPQADIGSVGELDVGETWTYTSSYIATQADIDSGVPLVNNISATSNETNSDVKTSSATTTITQLPVMIVSKMVDQTSIDQPGVLNYVITVENDGNVNLNNVTPADIFPDGSAGTIIGPTADIGMAGVLDVGEIWTYNASYAVTQQDIDEKTNLTNKVSFTANESGNIEFSDTAITAVERTPSLVVAKNVDKASLNALGSLNYTIAVQNTGNISLTDVSVVDVLPDGTTGTVLGPVADIGFVGKLDVGETWNFTAVYNVTQLELDQGFNRTNTVYVTSTETGTDSVSDTAVTSLTQTPSFSVNKTAGVANVDAVGPIQYEITVANTGNISLSDIQLNDTLPNGMQAVLSGPAADFGMSGVLDVGETWTFLGEYTVTQADMDAGLVLSNVVNVSTAEAGSQDDSALTTVIQESGISITKQNVETDFTSAGDLVNYTLVVTNIGNVEISDIQVSDPQADVNSLTCDLGSNYSLFPAEQATCTVYMTIQPLDLVATEILNEAFVTGVDTDGEQVNASSGVVVVPMLQIPPVASDDYYVSQVRYVAVTLEGASNDTDVNGDLDLSTLNLIGTNAVDTDGDGDNDIVNVVGEGQWVVNNSTGQVTFTPEVGFTGDPTPVTYVVSDATNLLSNAATLSIDYPQKAPVAENDYKINNLVGSPSNPTSVNVLSDNGSGPDTDTENDIKIDSVHFVSANAIDTDNDGDSDKLVVAGEGVWVIDNLTATVTFTPEQGFLLDPTPIFYVVSDRTGLVSNTASITIDYPQTAPVANDDEKLEQPLLEPVVLAVLVNDTDPESNIDPTTVMLIDPVTDERTTNLVVVNEGVWSVDTATGTVTFTPEPSFISNPTSVYYTVKDTTEIESNQALLTITYEEPAALEGYVWLDSNLNGELDADEQTKAAWALKVYRTDGTLLAETITAADGSYLVTGLPSDAFYVEFYNEYGVYMGVLYTDGVVLPGSVVNLPLPVDPGGIVYDSISREPVGGVTLNLVNGNDDLLHADCLFANQQSQVTADDGLYAFNLIPGAHSSCPENGFYRIEIASTPTEYRSQYSSYIRQEGAADCGDVNLGCAVSGLFESDETESNCTIDSLPGTNACEVQEQPDAPDESETTQYFVEFYIQPGDRSVIFNHLPIDAIANDASIILSKVANKREVSIGSLLTYTIDAENTKEFPAVDITIVDTPPGNFSLVDESISLVTSGVDGEFETDDDVITYIRSVETNPIVLENIGIPPFETVRIKYVMRVGIGVVAGRYVNEAVANGPGGKVSNLVSTSVEVIPDPVLEQASLVGKVFNDRDADGQQDPAMATGVGLRSQYYGREVLGLPNLPGRSSVNANPAKHEVTVNMPVSRDNRFMVITKEGTRISVDHDGTITEAHVGDKAKGLNAQDIRVCTQFDSAVPTDRSGVTQVNGLKTEVVQIVIKNYGVNEEGIPGVRLATVTGLLIETDAYGRYSIPDVEAGTTGIGQNFVLKVDPDTLPQGAVLTTENPYVLRIRNSSLNKINFGVKVPESDPYLSNSSSSCDESVAPKLSQTVEVSLGYVFFKRNKTKIRNDQRGIVNDIINKLREYGGGKIIVEARVTTDELADYNLSLAERRAEHIRELLKASLDENLLDSVQVEVKSAVKVEQAK